MNRLSCGASDPPVGIRSGESALTVAAVGKAAFRPSETMALLNSHLRTEVTPAAAKKSLIARLRCGGEDNPRASPGDAPGAAEPEVGPPDALEPPCAAQYARC